MGLDMYAYSIKPEYVSGIVDFEIPEEAEKTEIAYWRKHPNLHGWMENLYRENGGKDEQFNVVPVVLTLEDLEQLESDITKGNLPHTEGFFFGQSYLDENEKKDDLEFISKAREAISRGLVVYYTSWW